METEIIPNKPNPDAWKQVLVNWRLPTWQWAVEFIQEDGTLAYGIPEVFQPATWAGNTNPLYQFVNPLKDSSQQPAAMGDVSVMGKYAIPEVISKIPVSTGCSTK